MAIVYEQQEPKSDGTQDVIFNRFSLLDLLGEGWSYSAATPPLRSPTWSKRLMWTRK